MDPTLELEARRLLISAALTTQVLRRLRGRIAADSTAGDLLALARSLREETTSVEHTHHLRFDPPYPGVTAGPEVVPAGLRLLLACTAFNELEKPLGVVFTTLIPGRLPQVSVAPVEARIPEEWYPLADPS